jgi:hypothetical protein
MEGGILGAILAHVCLICRPGPSQRHHAVPLSMRTPAFAFTWYDVFGHFLAILAIRLKITTSGLHTAGNWCRPVRLSLEMPCAPKACSNDSPLSLDRVSCGSSRRFSWSFHQQLMRKEPTYCSCRIFETSSRHQKFLADPIKSRGACVEPRCSRPNKKRRVGESSNRMMAMLQLAVGYGQVS